MQHDDVLPGGQLQIGRRHGDTITGRRRNGDGIRLGIDQAGEQCPGPVGAIGQFRGVYLPGMYPPLHRAMAGLGHG